MEKDEWKDVLAMYAGTIGNELWEIAVWCDPEAVCADLCKLLRVP